MSGEAASVRAAGSKYELAVGGAVLSALSFLVVFYAAAEEPFLVFRWSDFALNVGLGTVIFVAFASWGVACVRSFRRSPRRSLGTVLLVCACALWTAMNLFYLGNVIYGYRQDMTNPLLQHLR